MTAPAVHSPLSPWRVALALGLVYTCWGTTYFAIREGVKTLPPALFGGVRILVAGLVLLSFLVLSGRRITMSRRDLGWTWLVGICLFVGGNGLITVAQKTVPSGIASVLVATTPLWMALLETAWPTGEHLSLRGWLGLLGGLAGVALLMADKLHAPAGTDFSGYLLVLGSAFAWAIGAFVQRGRRASVPLLTSAAWQMFLGGTSLALLGCCLGEVGTLTADCFTLPSVAAFFYLLVVGSLIGFVAFTWLLGHVSAALAGSYAYVNPVVALLTGWLLGGESLTMRVICGMAIILAGVALVRTGSVQRPRVEEEPEEQILFRRERSSSEPERQARDQPSPGAVAHTRSKPSGGRQPAVFGDGTDRTAG